MAECMKGMNNLSDQLRRGADFLMDVHHKQHPNQPVWTPWYIEAMREAADILEQERVKIDTNERR